MKTVTFFSEKGGVGKTTMSVMFASWLSYNLAESVWVTDFDAPSYHLCSARNRDSMFWECGKYPDLNRAVIQNAVDGFYPIGRGGLPDKDHYTEPELKSIVNTITTYKRKHPEDGYYILDFPGRFLKTDPIYSIVAAGLMDFIVYVMDSDIQSRSSTMMVHGTVMSINPGQKCAILWNREAQAERDGKRDWYGQAQEKMGAMGIPSIGTRMRDIVSARRDADSPRFVRSTICWPRQNIAMSCPYVEDIFREVKDRIDGKIV